MKAYNDDTALIDMLLSQLEFQRQLLIKRNIIAPDDTNFASTKKLENACYHATCTNVELAEFIEQLNTDKNEITEAVLLELTDAFTFLLNQLLYINVLPTKTLSYYYNNAKNRLKKLKTSSYAELIGLYNLKLGSLYHKTRYKTWKTYSEVDDDIYSLILLLDEVLIHFIMLYIKANVQVEQIYNLFYKKYEINVNRQQIGGKYETV